MFERNVFCEYVILIPIQKWPPEYSKTHVTQLYGKSRETTLNFVGERGGERWMRLPDPSLSFHV